MSKNRIEISQEQFAKDVSKRINDLFNKSEFKTQDQLSLESGVSTATISVLLNGKHNISAHNLAQIINVLGGSADYVFFGKEHEKPATKEIRKILEEFEVKIKKIIEVNDSRIIDIQDKQVKETINLIMGHKIINSDIWNAIQKFAKSNDHSKVQTVIRLIKYIF